MVIERIYAFALAALAVTSSAAAEELTTVERG
jgi:hypothetical protein